MAKGGYQRRRLQAKKQAERNERKRAQRRRMMAQAGIAGVVLLILLLVFVPRGSGKYGVGFFAFDKGEAPAPTALPTDGTESSASPSPGPCTMPGRDTAGKKQFAAPPCMTIDASKTYTATMKTSLGDIELELFAKEAPQTVNNFVFLAEQDFYDGTPFHRVIPDFGGPGSNMVQGGDAANRNGTGDPGYKFGDENMVPFETPGVIAMANSGPGTNGSQFFLLDGKVGHLNRAGACPGPSGCHSVFGKIVAGLDVVAKIAKVERGPNDQPVKDVVLLDVTISTGS